jgi:hypothetical protein
MLDLQGTTIGWFPFETEKAPVQPEVKYRLNNAETWFSTFNFRFQISDHQQRWGHEDGPWKEPGQPLLVAAD